MKKGGWSERWRDGIEEGRRERNKGKERRKKEQSYCVFTRN